jgi:AAA domain
MIKLESAHIEEIRGIRKLDIEFAKGPFAISGPNGSGKSGVIDAIEFGLTGQIGRLTGKGTKGLSVAEHGPHVDKSKFPDVAFVTLRVFLEGPGKSATITRKVSSPKKPEIDPADADVLHAFAEIADHPEITLSRRDILRFILVEPTARSQEIQAILKLDAIGETRSSLNTAQNKLQSVQRTAEAQMKSSHAALRLHLQVDELNSTDLLEIVNKRRRLLDLPEFAALTSETKLDQGLAAGAKQGALNKKTALLDLMQVAEGSVTFPCLAKENVASILANLAKLEADPALFSALQRRSFIEKGLELVDGSECPLCDTQWEDEQCLADHLRAKLAKSEEAQKLNQSLMQDGAAIAESATKIIGLLAPIKQLANTQGDKDFEDLLGEWAKDIEELKTKVKTTLGLASLKERLCNSLWAMPKDFPNRLSGLTEKIRAKPDQGATVDAQTFLTTAQIRLDDYRAANKAHKKSEAAHKSAKLAYETYCSVLEEELNVLYDDVQKDFSTYYREVNQDDEDRFTAKLTPTEGSLGLDVNFYDRGLFPPAAFHSEGHQDGMGVCLYLALMKRLFGQKFTFALLDDVVMSVDADHRYQFCKLLKTHFPNTQFVITTHDRLWAEQMKSAGLVTAKTSLCFHSWTIDTGPLVESSAEIWKEISDALAKGKVEAAAAALRHHLEYVSRHLADQFGATPQFRADGNYELGELLPSVLKRIRELYGKAADAAQSWGDNEAKEAALNRKASLTALNGAVNVEQWAVNKAVHYNEWANFGKKDFEPVVAAFNELLECFQCVKCGSWLHIAPRVRPETLRCSCSSIQLNLRSKAE